MKDKTLGFLLLLVAAFMGFGAAAQPDGNWRSGSLYADSMVLKIDSLSVIPQSFQLLNARRDQYSLDPLSATLRLADSALLGQTLSYRYKVFPADYSRPFRHKPLSLLEPAMPHYEPSAVTAGTTAGLYPDDAIVGSGSVSRGVSAGSNQDMALHSGLDIHLSGHLSDDVEFTAAVTDRNIPIQPEGNTQVLQDFSKVFLTVKYRDLLTVDAGDVEFKCPEDDFLTVHRNLSGMNLSVGGRLKKAGGRVSNLTGGGMTKGRFARQKVVTQDGVQGPYRLYGEHNEINMVIVAGSERVYVDGRLLRRGQDRDYTIDYNLAELTFTPSMLMTSEKRVTVEFEYTGRSYSRYNIYTCSDMEGGLKNKFRLKVNYYQERDMRNRPADPGSGPAQKLFLAGMGDSVSRAFCPYADSAAYNPERIQYKRIDTIADGVLYRDVYVYAHDAAVQLYHVGFTYMGPQKGDYRLLQSTANGRVFGWVAPDGGIPQGDYAPVRRLHAPQSMQMATLSAGVDFGGKAGLRAEFAVSDFDKNTFSDDDDRDNAGFACLLSFRQTADLKAKRPHAAGRKLQTALDWQFVHKNFHAVESFRNVEFARDYNLAADYGTARSDQMLTASVRLACPESGATAYTLNWLTRFHEVNALRHEILSQNRIGPAAFNTRTSFLHSADSVQKSRFLTSDNLFSYKFGKVELGFTDMVEHNVFRNTSDGSLRPGSYAFNEARLYLENADSTRLRYLLSYKNRVEAAPCGRSLSLYKDIHEAAFRLGMYHVRNHRLDMKLTYRRQRLRDSLKRFGGEDYFVGDLEYTGRFLRNALIISTYYEAGSGMELKKTFTFLKTAPGAGTHVWNDYNGNGTAETDEFEPAAFAGEADYIKVWLPGTDYVNTYGNRLTQSIQWRPAALWGNKKGFRRLMARFSDSAVLRTRHKRAGSLAWQAFNPFGDGLSDTVLVSGDLSFNNTLSFNNSASLFAFDCIVQERQGKSLLYYGFEHTAQSMQQLVVKSAPCKALALQADYAHSTEGNRSGWLPSRCYDIENHRVGTQCKLQFRNSYYGRLTYDYSMKRNRSGGETLREHRAGVEFDCRSTRFGTLTASAQYVYMKGLDDCTTPVAYMMLGGLRGGANALWSVGYQASVTEFLVLTVRYDGRAGKGHKAVHTANMTVKAQF